MTTLIYFRKSKANDNCMLMTFQRNHMWNALLVDAEARGVYIKMDWNVDLEKMKRHIIR